MERFPESHELISFFECEPTLLDPGKPWVYNRLEFRTVRGADELVVVIEPGFEIFKLRWRREGKEVIRLDLDRVSGLDLEMAPGRELMVLQFRRSVGIAALRFHLKPHPHIDLVVLPDGV